jgi:hypothetical protein
VLRQMRRGYSRERYLDIVRNIREVMPDAVGRHTHTSLPLSIYVCMCALVYHGRLHSGLSRRDRRAVPADSQAHGPGQDRIEYGLVSSDFLLFI